MGMMVRLVTKCKNCGHDVEWDERANTLRHVEVMPSGYRPISCMLDPGSSVPMHSAQPEDDPVWEVTR